MNAIGNSRLVQDINIEQTWSNFDLISKKLNSNWDIEIEIESNWNKIKIYAKWVISKDEKPFYYLDWNNKIDIENDQEMIKKIKVIYLQESASSDKYVNSYLRLNSLLPEYKDLVDRLLNQK